jgi:hypothetical protein
MLRKLLTFKKLHLLTSTLILPLLLACIKLHLVSRKTVRWSSSIFWRWIILDLTVILRNRVLFQLNATLVAAALHPTPHYRLARATTATT